MKNPNWLSDDEQKFWRLLLAASRKVNHHIETVLQDDHNLTSAEFAVLVNLSESPEKEIQLRDREYAKDLIVHLMMYSLLMMNMLNGK